MTTLFNSNKHLLWPCHIAIHVSSAQAFIPFVYLFMYGIRVRRVPTHLPTYTYTHVAQKKQVLTSRVLTGVFRDDLKAII